MLNERCNVCTLHHRPVCPGSKANKWPLAPLLAAAPSLSQRAVMARLNVSGTDIVTARNAGLTDRQADNWSTRMGWHPSMIWPAWDRAGLTVLDDVFVNGGGWRTTQQDTLTTVRVAA